jgi:16S rRNA (guanine527-N7)-methyltransferase
VPAHALETKIGQMLRGFQLEPAPGRRPELCRDLARWAELVLEWNRRVDLTAARSDDELLDLLIADAAAIARTRNGTGTETWVDVGSGAGGPGLALSLLLPNIRMTLVEPKTKRVAFLRAVVGELRLDNVTVERKRSEELPPGTFQVAISRATFSPAEWLAEGARIAQGEVWVLIARSEPPELAGLSLSGEHAYEWPLTSVARAALLYSRDLRGK